MFDMGFLPDVRRIVGRMPGRKQTLLFSATYPDSIRAIAGNMMREPLQVTVEGAQQQTAIEQRFFDVDPAQAEPVLAEAERRGWPITAIWNTHWHPDHTGGNAGIKAATGCTVIAPAAEAARGSRRLRPEFPARTPVPYPGG